MKMCSNILLIEFENSGKIIIPCFYGHWWFGLVFPENTEPNWTEYRITNKFGIRFGLLLTLTNTSQYLICYIANLCLTPTKLLVVEQPLHNDCIHQCHGHTTQILHMTDFPKMSLTFIALITMCNWKVCLSLLLPCNWPNQTCWCKKDLYWRFFSKKSECFQLKWFIHKLKS